MQIPVWEKYSLTIEEAAAYYRIGENKLRRIVSENQDAQFLLKNGNRTLIKRAMFSQYLDRSTTV